MSETERGNYRKQAFKGVETYIGHDSNRLGVLRRYTQQLRVDAELALLRQGDETVTPQNGPKRRKKEKHLVREKRKLDRRNARLSGETHRALVKTFGGSLREDQILLKPDIFDPKNLHERLADAQRLADIHSRLRPAGRIKHAMGGLIRKS